MLVDLGDFLNKLGARLAAVGDCTLLAAFVAEAQARG